MDAMDISFLGKFWIFSDIVIVAFYIFVTYDDWTPQCVRDMITYGKLNKDRSTWSFVQLFEVPKRYFTYFYLFGLLTNGSFLVLAAYCYSNGIAFPHMLRMLSEKLASNKLLPEFNASTPILLGVLMTVQNLRRLYESTSISIYSNSTINVVHFAYGILLYTTYPLVIISSAHPPELHSDTLVSIQYSHVFGIGLFIWSSYHQHKAIKQLAKLRLDKSGEVESYKHMAPSGGHFDLVSCPHFLMEILIYISFSITHSFTNHTQNCLTVFVVVNQIVAALLGHKWYGENFKNYPKHRKAIIPFIL